MAVIDKVSPFAPESLPDMPEIAGVRFRAVAAGLRYQGRKDLLLAVLDEGAVAAGVTTRSKTCSAPVLWCREQLRHASARALVVNAGNANAFTGKRGEEAVRLTVEGAGAAVGCRPEEVFVASTGVIGEPMDASAFCGLLAGMADAASSTAWEDAARAIMTTDTYPKLSHAEADLGGGVRVRVGGIAKGSGMIAPDMATMLSFVFTDAKVAPDLLQRLTRDTARQTFNCVTVDGDTSTSDTVLVFATGKEGPELSDPASPEALAFAEALQEVFLDLAHQIVRDGEGASKFVEIEVSGAEDDVAAHRIAMTLANSPILKAAIAGEDPNWGRVVMAVGKSGEAADRDRLEIRFGEHLVATHGQRAPGYSEEAAAAYMKQRELEISVDVGIAFGQARVWTCDLTHDYIRINADYRS